MKQILIAGMALTLSACVVAIGTDEPYDGDYVRHKGPNRHITVNLDHHGEQHFECPAGLESFYTENDDGDITYGCRSISDD